MGGKTPRAPPPFGALYDSGPVNPSQMDPPSNQALKTRPLRVIAVAGIDPGGGAGLVRDVLTGAALGVAVAVVGTAWTEQRPGRVVVEPRAPEAVGEALRQALARYPDAAVKIGMVGGRDVALAIADAMTNAPERPVILDPVLAASGGGRLWSGPLDGLWPLLRRASLVTPNAVEAAALSGQPVGDAAQAVAAAQILRDQGVAAVLVKGGHLSGDAATVTDILVDAEGVRRFSRPRAAGPTPRGTGCALSTAIAATVAGGATLPDAVEEAGRWLAGRIAGRVMVGDQWFLP